MNVYPYLHEYVGSPNLKTLPQRTGGSSYSLSFLKTTSGSPSQRNVSIGRKSRRFARLSSFAVSGSSRPLKTVGTNFFQCSFKTLSSLPDRKPASKLYRILTHSKCKQICSVSHAGLSDTSLVPSITSLILQSCDTFTLLRTARPPLVTRVSGNPIYATFRVFPGHTYIPSA